ncbi:MAG TPA: M20/M25/M40 family metallo-hydrolase [Bacteroidales bacterium]|nr:M20/M25/M40 family metallo-hydrolase [Bacteroidales bacterium]
MKKISAIITLFFFVCAGNAQKQPENPGLKYISGSEMMKNVSFFASEKLEGRFPASEGYHKSAAYAAAYFKSLGLEPYQDNTYFQPVPVEYNEFSGPVKLEKIDKGKSVKQFKPGIDFVCRGFSGKGSFAAPVVFCGYGMTFPSLGYDDYASVDVKGKIVIVFKQNPAWAKDVKGINELMTRYKANNAEKNGAKAILFVTTPNMPDPQKPIGSLMDGEGIQNPDFPQMQVSLDVANELLTNSGKKLSEIQTQIDSLKKPFSIITNDSLFLEVHTAYEKERLSENIIAVLPGSDQALKNEYVVIGAHLDHVGKQGDVYFPGANDNASGSAAVMEIAKAFATSGEKPKRSVIFVLFTSEEQGLFGSEYFTAHPPVPLEKTVAMINLDCIGFGDSIQVGGGLSAPVLWNIARKQDSLNTKLMISKTWYGGGADAQAFFDKSIPTLYFASKNSYKHLHLTTDTPETLNPVLLEKMAKLAFLVTLEVAEGRYSKENIQEKKSN